MVIETMALSLIIGKIRGGKIRNLESLYIRGWYLFVASFSIEIVSLLIVSKLDNRLSDLVVRYFAFIHILIYLLLTIGLGMNLDTLGFKIIFAGSALNFAAIGMNSGRMPVSAKALIYSQQYIQLSLLEEERIMTHVLADKSTRLIWLVDIIPIPKPYIFPKIISIGDVLIGLGLFILICTYMKKRIME